MVTRLVNHCGAMGYGYFHTATLLRKSVSQSLFVKLMQRRTSIGLNAMHEFLVANMSPCRLAADDNRARCSRRRGVFVVVTFDESLHFRLPLRFETVSRTLTSVFRSSGFSRTATLLASVRRVCNTAVAPLSSKCTPSHVDAQQYGMYTMSPLQSVVINEQREMVRIYPRVRECWSALMLFLAAVCKSSFEVQSVVQCKDTVADKLNADTVVGTLWCSVSTCK